MCFLSLLILTAILVTGILFALFLFLNPQLAIEIQRKFYERINWRIEPISMEKEILNTRIMGLLLAAVAFLVILFIIIKVIFAF